MQSAIQLQNHKFLKIELNAQKFNGDNTQYKLSHALTVQPNEDDSTRWQARLDLRIANESEDTISPYIGELSIAGHFTLAKDFPQDKAEQMVHLNAGAILYGAIRELVLTLTSRSIHGELILPTIDARTFLPEKRESENPPAHA